MADGDMRRVTLERLDEGGYLARNARGLELRFGSFADDAFSPVELLLAAIAGCTAVDVDVVTGRRAKAEEFGATIEARYVRDDEGNRLEDVELTFRLRFPDGPEGDKAREVAPRALRTSHDRTCTVSRTIERGTPIRASLDLG